jgi:hypothetical protein
MPVVFLFSAMVSGIMLDLIHRIHEADESFRSLDFMVHSRLFLSQIVLQKFLGTLTPLLLLALTQLITFPGVVRKRIYTLAGILTLIGIFAMRWNVVIGGQLFSKSFLGYTHLQNGFCHPRRTSSCSRARWPLCCQKSPHSCHRGSLRRWCEMVWPITGSDLRNASFDGDFVNVRRRCDLRNALI